MSHDADLAWLHVKEVVEVARRTYEYMGQLRVRHPGCATSKEAVPFENLTKAIEDYAACTTKDCKRNWLIEHQQGAELAQTLTVSGRGAGQLNVRIGRSYPDAPAGTALVADAQRFVDAWLARKNPLAAAEQIDLDSLRSQFAGAEGVLGSESHDGNNARREWTQRFLTMYLADDHAAVNEYGHGNPAAHRYSELPLQPQTDGRFQSWEKINVPQIEPEDFLAIDDGSYVLVLLFDQMPHDSALLTWKEREGKWKVSGLLGFVD